MQVESSNPMMTCLLVIMLEIKGFNTKRVLVDNGSSTNIMYIMAYQQLRLEPKWLQPFKSLLVSFNGDQIYPKGIISLRVIAGTHPAQITKQVDFLIIDCPSFYNVILGWPTLNRLKAATSTYCLKVKLPTPYGIREICRDQLLAQGRYQAMLAFRENHTWVVEEEPKEASPRAGRCEPNRRRHYQGHEDWSKTWLNPEGQDRGLPEAESGYLRLDPWGYARYKQ